MRAPEWFKQAGLSEVRAQTFVSDINPPLSQEMRKALVDLFEMRWGEDKPELLEEDQLKYKRLCRDDSPDFILNMPGTMDSLHIHCFGAECCENVYPENKLLRS